MSAVEYGFAYKNPENTYTLQDYIACQSDTVMCYKNTSIIDRYNGMVYEIYNVVSDYLDEIRDNYCVEIEMTPQEMERYKFKPKLLCYDLYKNQELAFIILLINDMYTVKQFTKRKILLPSQDNMEDLCNRILNANRSVLNNYSTNN